MNRRAVTVVLALAVLAALPAAAQAAYKPFRLPSGGVHCAYIKARGIAAHVRCDALFLNDMSAVVKVRGRARFRRVSDTVADPRSPILRYGKTRRFGKLRCRSSRRHGIRCRSSVTGNGFYVSRERQGIF